MTVRERLHHLWTSLSSRLLARAPAVTWLTGGVLVVTLVWGAIDPFGLRQRLDWMVGDQFLRHRSAPAVHPDILQVSIDDRTAEEVGFPLRRHVLAGVVRQLHALGARTVMIDILFDEAHEEIALKEAERWLVRPARAADDPEIGRRFVEDQVLGRALADFDRMVIPFFLYPPGPKQAGDEKLIATLSSSLADQPTPDAAELAERLGLERERVRRLFGVALQAAMDKLVSRVREQSPAGQGTEIGPEAALAEALPDEVPQSVLGSSFLRAWNRAIARRLLLEKGSLAVEWPRGLRPVIASDEPRTPRPVLAASAATLGFFDAELDADGRLRNMPVVGRWGDRLVFHQSFLAALRHAGHEIKELHVTPGGIETSLAAMHVPIDSRGRLTINWPMNRGRDWTTAIPQLSVADLVGLDRAEADLLKGRHQLRDRASRMAELAKDTGGWRRHFESIVGKYEQGDLDGARRLETTFDERALPYILGLDAVRAATEQARSHPTPDADAPPEEQLVQLARAVLAIGEQLPAVERELHTMSDELRERVQGKLCLIGDTQTASADLKQTPMAEVIPGISVNAAVVNTVLTGRHLRVCGFLASAGVMLLVVGAASVAFYRLHGFWSGCCAVAAALVLLLGSLLGLQLVSVLVSPVTPLVGLIGSYSTITTYRWWDEYRQKKLVRTIFEAQTNPTIVERLIEAGQAGVEEVLAPKTRQVTVFFAEIADFEELSAQVAPERLPEIFSRTFGTMAKVILANEGTLDRYQGHALVAFFGAPIYQPDHAYRGCRAALECRDTLRSVADKWQAQGLPAPGIHIGIHTGELLVGNITLTSRVDYTVAGDNLNVAYRIGELNETYGSEILISEATLARAENVIEARELDLVRIKGRREPLRAYELMSARGQLSPAQLELRGTWATGLSAFRNRDYTSALTMFRTCRAAAPGDRATTIYIERCEKELTEKRAG